jgi:hypothetical protein
MSRLDSFQSLPTACAAAASAAGTWLSVAAEVALQIFGVPLPVVLAALTGAFGARVFLPPGPFWRASATTVMWTFAGAFLAQLVLWIAAKWIEGAPPAGALAGLALVAAFIGQRVAPIVWDKGGAALERKFDQLWKGGSQ